MTAFDNELESVRIIDPHSPVSDRDDEEFHTTEIITVGLAHGTNDLFFSFIPPLQPLLMEKLSLSNAQAGLFTVFLQGPSLLQPFIGHYADRHNLRTLFIVGPTISAIMLTMVGLAPSYGILALLMLIAGFSTAGFHSIAPVITASKAGKKIGRGMAFFMLFGEFGYGMGPLLLIGVVGLLTVNELPWLISLGALCSIILCFNFKNFDTSRQTREKGLVISQETRKEMVKIMLPIIIYAFITSFIYANIINFLPTYLKNEGASFNYYSSAFSIIEVSATIGIFFSGWVSDRIGQRVIVFISTITTVIFSLMLLFTNGWWQIPVLVALGLLAFSPNPALSAIVQTHFPENRSLANGLYMSVNFVIRSLGVFLVGLLADHFGLRNVFFYSCLTALFGLPVILMLPKK